MEGIFWISVIGAVYSYFLYPLILLLLPRRQQVASAGVGHRPFLSIIITAHNEQARLPAKLDNTVAVDYPADHREIIVASDASTDRTDEIAREYADRGVRLVRAEERRGKEYAQLQAVRQARGEILVFSDVATEIAPGSVSRMVELFADPAVGAVSSEDQFVSPEGQPVGEGIYVRYEMWLRRMESRVRGLVGLSGSFFAARSEVCRDWDINAPSDFNTALNCARNGLVAVSDPRVVGRYASIKDERGEYRRKYRTVLRGITGLFRQLGVLNPMRFGLFSFQVWSHKVMRWLVPWFMLLALLTALYLAPGDPLYAALLGLQLLFYALVALGALMPSSRERVLVKIPYFFVQVNVAIAHATLAYLSGTRMTVWQPSAR